MPRVLAIQSHVVSGYVGNKCATFPLQLLGIDVDPLNTVQVSNHSGYPVIHGLRMDADHFELIFEALEANEKNHYDFIHSGYLGNPTSVPTIGRCVSKLLQKNTGLRYLLDPVLGDHGKLYLPKEMIELYQRILIPMAYVMTPNQFEAEVLSNQSISNLQNAIQVAHALGPPMVIITTLDTPDVANENTLSLLAYDKSRQLAYCIQYPRLNTTFTGTGDLFSALLVAQWVQKQTLDLPTMCTNAVWVMQKVLQETLQYSSSFPSFNKSQLAKALHMKELRLIQCKSDIEALFTISIEDKKKAGIHVIQSQLELNSQNGHHP
ncbi:hypothetical protein HMI54_011280 [Coelomomyces lativittatus]|nr:hypothetical protein HMI54_011280 [Coelomomyces lativittatus]KAJ1508522.1 hypothetical protein HMI56_007249 [Coelomomyces lativittatus]KAJ1516917.1 hypothetical protein HMI55_001075 [Coelomomyces lativittatus]